MKDPITAHMNAQIIHVCEGEKKVNEVRKAKTGRYHVSL